MSVAGSAHGRLSRSLSNPRVVQRSSPLARSHSHTRGAYLVGCAGKCGTKTHNATCAGNRSHSEIRVTQFGDAMKNGKLPEIREALNRLHAGADYLVTARELQKIQREVGTIINAQLMKNLKAEDVSAMNKLLAELDHWTSGFHVTAYIAKQLTLQRGDVVRDLTTAMNKSNEKLKEAMEKCNQTRLERAESRTRLAAQNSSAENLCVITDGKLASDDAKIERLKIELHKVVGQNRSLFGKAVKDETTFFQALDRDGGGTVTTAEFKDGMKRLGLHVSEDEIGAFTRKFDHDCSGELELAELAAVFGDALAGSYRAPSNRSQGEDRPRRSKKKSSADDVAVGDRVMVASENPEDPYRGVVRFVGTTSFADGNWAGIELDEPRGKNDGQVQGKRYFECKPLYGYFIKSKLVVKDTAA